MTKVNDQPAGREPVIIRACVEQMAATVEDTKIDGAEWDAMTPAQRRELVLSIGTETMNNAGGYGASILSGAPDSDLDDPAEEPIVVPAPAPDLDALAGKVAAVNAEADDGPGYDQHGLHNSPTPAQRIADAAAEMTGPVVAVEPGRVPFDEVLIRAAEERHALDPNAQDYHRRQALNAIRHCSQAALAELVTAIRELQDGDALAREYEPPPILRSELVGKLDHRRNAPVYVYVPVDGREPARLDITRVAYLPSRDHIALYTVPWYLGVEPDPPVSAEGATVSAAALTAERFGPVGGDR